MVDYTAGLLAALMWVYEIPYLIPTVPLIGLLPLTLSAFCASDPPAVPTFTQAEVDAMLQLQLGADFDSGVAKMKDLLYNLIWYDSCECTSGALIPLTPPAQPPGSITTVFPRGTESAPCESYTHVLTWTVTNVQNFNMGVPTHHPIQPTAYLVHCVNNIVSGGGVSVRFTLEQYNVAESAVLKSDFVVVAPGATADLVVGSISTFDSIHVVVTGQGGAGVSSFQSTRVDWFCGNDLPGGTRQPCCPPDPATAATLQHILDLVQSMQRNYHPFAYLLGSSHAVSGVGSFAVSRTLGVKVEITAHPTSNPQLAGNPAYVKDLGWMSVSEADGMIQERRISQLGFTWFPQLAPIADHVNYDLFPGVTATFTEILPEP